MVVKLAVAILMVISLSGKDIRSANESVNSWSGTYSTYSLKGSPVGKSLIHAERIRYES